MEFCTKVNFRMETDAVVKVYTKGDVVIKEGRIGKEFLCLLSGDLTVYNYTEAGKEFLLHKVMQNQLFGDPAVLLELPFPGNVEVVSEEAEILQIPREKFIKFLMNHPEDMLVFTKSMAEKSIKKSQSLKNIAYLNPEERIAKQLDEYREEFADSPERVKVKLTRKEISNMTGLCVETVIRTVKKMEKEGKLKIKQGKIFY